MHFAFFKSLKRSLILCCAITLFSCTHSPEIQDKLWESPGTILFPDKDPEAWLMAHLDVETTGLVPGYHEMIDLGLVYTSLDGRELDSLFLRIMPQHPDRTAPKAAEINGFSVEKWRRHGALSPAEAVDSLISFHQRVSQEKNVLLTAFNSQFDTAFLDHLFRGVGRSWRELYFYFVLDIPSMAWGLGFTDLTTQSLMKQYEVVDEPHVADQHTGITGAKKNVRVYQALLEELVQLRAPFNSSP